MIYKLLKLYSMLFKLKLGHKFLFFVIKISHWTVYLFIQLIFKETKKKSGKTNNIILQKKFIFNLKNKIKNPSILLPACLD
jgi:hypothetical protein